MAISLDRVNRPKVKKQNKKIPSDTTQATIRPGRRPWHVQATLAQNTKFVTTTRDAALNFDFQPDHLLLTPDDLDAATSAELLQVLAKQWIEDRWRKAQRRSYWLSRLTHRHSWLARVQFFPRLRIPLPSWVASREKDVE